MERRGPKTLLNSAAVVSGDKQKELMLPGSLTGEPGYASILWADDQGISSEISRSLSFFNSSCGGRGVGVRCQLLLTNLVLGPYKGLIIDQLRARTN